METLAAGKGDLPVETSKILGGGKTYVAIRSLFPTENRSRFLRPYFSVFTTPLRAGSLSYSFFFIISAIG